MTADSLRLLFDYHAWANARLLTVVGALSEEEFTRDVAGGWGSVRDTLVHTLSTERGWLDRCGGPARGPRLDPADYPTPEALRAAWAESEALVSAFVEELDDADLERGAVYAGAGGAQRSMPVGALLHHVATHAVHHRGQAAVLLRELGHTPPAMDLLFYYAERRGVEAW